MTDLRPQIRRFKWGRPGWIPALAAVDFEPIAEHGERHRAALATFEETGTAEDLEALLDAVERAAGALRVAFADKRPEVAYGEAKKALQAAIESYGEAWHPPVQLGSMFDSWAQDRDEAEVEVARRRIGLRADSEALLSLHRTLGAEYLQAGAILSAAEVEAGRVRSEIRAAAAA